MKISQTGLELIKRFEGCRLVAYKDSGGTLTIGYGHTKGVTAGQTITQAQADAFLVEDCASAEAAVNKYMSKYNFNQNQFDALVSFAFNIGSIDKLTVNGTRTIAQISEKIPAYCNCAGKKLQGLVNRRAAEKELFDTPVSGQVATQETIGQFVKGYAHSIGETVTYSTCYEASTDPVEKAITCNPWKTGKITKIKTGAKNPYLIEDGRCWVNDGDIRSETTSTAVKETQAEQSVSVDYVVGQTYTLQAEMKVRAGAGTNNSAKTHTQLTADGKKHDADKDGALDKGTVVTCQEVKKVGSDIWIRTPSGWIAAYYGGKVYVK